MKKHLLLKITAMGLFFCSLAIGIHAQKTISGLVVDNNAEPLIGVNVSIEGTTVGTVTDFDGNFNLTSPSDDGVVVFSYLGFADYRMRVAEATDVLRIVLSESNNLLDEVVITGLASTVKRANAANSVARIDANQLVGVAPASTVDGALYGKFNGAEIRASSGAPGGGISFRLRGTTSISGSSQPLIILDGVYIDNSSIPAGLNVVSAAAGGGATSNQDNPSNRLADIDPGDIESVEILKGASAAAIYGSRASGGVVVINTKRGKAGPTQVTLSQSIGVAQQLRKLGVREFTEERVLGSNFADNIEEFRQAEAAGQIHNYEDELYGNKGLLSNTRISILGGTEKTSIYFGGSYKDEEGIVNNTGYEKVSGRFNMSHKIADFMDFELSSNYIYSSADRGFFNNDNSGTTMGVAFTSTPSFAQLFPNDIGVYPSNPYAPSNFLETAALMTNNEKVNRFIGGGTLTTRLFTNETSSLKLVGRAGLDSYTLNTTAIFPNTLQFQRDGAGLNGVSVQGNTNLLNNNLAAFLVHTLDISGNTFRSTLGATNENFSRNTILGTASNIIGTETNLDQSGSRNIEQNRLIQHDRGFFFQEEANFQDKIIATVGIRGDKSSNNSDVNKLYWYPKANIAFNLHNLGVTPGETINQLKLRLAYGESGNFATFGSKSTILGSTIVNGSPGVQVPNLLGNSEVGPERQKELEFGVDFGILDRVTAQFTYYIKKVDNLLLNADLPTSSGFSQQVTNAAALRNNGVELGINIAAVRTQNTLWDMNFNFWKNNSEVTRLDLPSYTTGGFADFLGQFRIMEGQSPTEIIGVSPDADGITVFGNAEPDFQMSLTNQVRFGNFDFNMLFHWKKGGSNINLSSLLFDLGNTTFDYDDTDLDPSGQLTNGAYRVSVIGSDTSPFIEDASYLRMREVGLYYNIPKGTLTNAASFRVGFSGNNLINVFNYRSYDPEVSNFGGGGLSTGVEVNPFPSSKRYDFHISATF